MFEKYKYLFLTIYMHKIVIFLHYLNRNRYITTKFVFIIFVLCFVNLKSHQISGKYGTGVLKLSLY